MSINIQKIESKIIVDLGSSLEINALDKLFECLDIIRKEIKRENVLVFNFNKLKFISPSAAVVVMAARDEFKPKCKEVLARIRRENKATKFMNAIGLLKTTKTLDSYIQNISDYVVRIEACKNFDECQDIGSEIVKKIEKRANCTKSTIKAINYMIDEISDNAGSHGYECYDVETFPKPVYMTAFSYSDKVEVAILDNGLGIHKHLTKNEKYLHLSAKEALNIAIQDKVSGHPKKSPGYGLFSASQFTSHNNGEMYIWSSSRKLIWKNSKAKVYKGALEFGTLVTFLVFKNVDIPFDRIVSDSTSDNYDFIFGE